MMKEKLEALKALIDALEDDDLGSTQIDRFEDKDLDIAVSTVKVFEGRKPYETAVFPQGAPQWIIVEAYLTVEEARAGHAKWVQTMKDQPKLTPMDCRNSYFLDLLQ